MKLVTFKNGNARMTQCLLLKTKSCTSSSLQITQQLSQGQQDPTTISQFQGSPAVLAQEHTEVQYYIKWSRLKGLRDTA